MLTFLSTMNSFTHFSFYVLAQKASFYRTRIVAYLDSVFCTQCIFILLISFSVLYLGLILTMSKACDTLCHYLCILAVNTAFFTEIHFKIFACKDVGFNLYFTVVQCFHVYFPLDSIMYVKKR